MATPTRAFVVDKAGDKDSSEFLYHWMNCLLQTLEEFDAEIDTHVKLPIDGGNCLIFLVTHTKVVEMETRLCALLEEVADEHEEDTAAEVPEVISFIEKMSNEIHSMMSGDCMCPMCQLKRKGVEEIPEWVTDMMSVIRMGLPSNLFWAKMRSLGVGKLRTIYEGLAAEKPLVEATPDFLQNIKQVLDEVAASTN